MFEEILSDGLKYDRKGKFNFVATPIQENETSCIEVTPFWNAYPSRIFFDRILTKIPYWPECADRFLVTLEKYRTDLHGRLRPGTVAAMEDIQTTLCIPFQFTEAKSYDEFKKIGEDAIYGILCSAMEQ